MSRREGSLEPEAADARPHRRRSPWLERALEGVTTATFTSAQASCLRDPWDLETRESSGALPVGGPERTRTSHLLSREDCTPVSDVDDRAYAPAPLNAVMCAWSLSNKTL